MRRSIPSFSLASHSAISMLFPMNRWRSLFVCGLVFVLGISRGFAQPPAAPAPPADAVPPKSSLPADYEPPRTVPPVMTEGKELTTDAQSEQLGTKLLRADRYQIVFSNARLDNKSKPIVEEWAKWRLYQMTLKSQRKRLHEVRADLMRDVSYAGRSPGVPKKDVEEFRRFLCEEVTKRAAELLANNFYARLNAVIVLAQLNLTDSDRRKELEERAYVQAALPLMDVLNAKTGGELDEQLEAVKIQAAIGLGRINLLGPPADLNISVEDKPTGRTENLRNVMAKTLIRELKNPDAHVWYQKRLIDALATIDLVNDLATGKPIIVEQLGEVLADSKRHYCVRARAARGLGRCPLPGSINTQKLVFQILLLEYDMASAYQKDRNLFYWKDCFSDVYYAFHPVSDEELQMFGNKRSPGLNQKPQLGALVKDAFDQIIPVTKHVVEQPGWTVPKEGGDLPPNAKIPDQTISDLAKWLQDHQPSNHKLAPNLPDLAPTSPIPTASTSSTTSS